MRLNPFAYFGIGILAVFTFFIAALLKLIGRITVDSFLLIKNMKKIKKARKTIKKYQSESITSMETYIKRHVKWNVDPIFGVLDFQQTPLSTLVRGRGDCDDFAVLYKKLIDKRYDCRLFSVIKNIPDGHVMLAVKLSDKSFRICSNDDTYTIRAESWEEAYHKAAKKFYGKYICVIKYFNFLNLPIWVVNLPKK